MNKPISYLQTDKRWKNHNYSTKGETKTIGSSGCGPTSAAMVIATLKDKNVTPITTAEWSMAHGYKALNQGTFYTYFVPQFSQYGIICKRLNNSNLYGKSSSTAHTEALNALKNGDWVIACMGKGNWTTSGHFILLYGYKSGYVYINDPASTKSTRVKNTWSLFAKQVKYLWTITIPDNYKNNISKPNTTNSASSNQTRYNFESIDYSLVFDPTYYANKYADLKKAFGTNSTALFNHFCSNGMKEGRVASANFNVTVYKNNYADLRNAFGNNLPLYYRHYITNGYIEKRKCI